MDKSKAVVVTKVPDGRARGLGRPVVSTSGRVRIEQGELPPRSRGPAARPWEPAGSIDVEDLVIWAFRDQHADRHASVGLHYIEAEAEGLDHYGRSSDGCAALSDIENLGCRIDRSVGIRRDLVHPAAEAVAVLVGEIDGGDLVRYHGRLGGRPGDWAPPVRWWRPVVVKPNGEAQWERTGPGNSPRFCRIIPTITREELLRRRLTYVRWWEALDQLAWRLSMRALGFTVLPPAAPQAPWDDQPEARGRV